MAAATTTSSSISVRLQIPGNLYKAEKNNKALALSDCYHSRNAAIKLKRRRFWAIASAKSPKGLDAINGKNLNGTYVVDKSPIKGNKHSEILTDASVDTPLHAYLLGKFVEDRFVYRQTFIIRSYETGPDKTATMETLMNLLQETALNHVTSSGLAGDGFGATREMSIRKLIWVVTRIHIQVQRYSCWGDVVEIDTWVDAEGKNGMRRDWIIRDYHTREIITRATSIWVIMNRETRRLSKIPEQVRHEVAPFYFHRAAISKEKNDSDKIDKLIDETAERIRTGLAPRWSDMDANQHVNNVKYIGWILESVPRTVLEDYYLTSMTLEYRRECRQSNLLESMTSPTSKVDEDSNSNTTKRIPDMKYTHMLRMQDDKAEIVRARTQWHYKESHHVSMNVI
ncbi:palmitoyl-acyl carrier protein thioesterase, chloroplastic-like [Humulus lupulus]|uniref:palmitoyl-acyl carrier protein thioesterase, chloroplastic-like n=1 Tax=Humulus lupulus TaxID=3486 RepID=UPI002B415873|nr:palmitoyl-acyl carrier protein thioesterase, chloroplastic-like [Humulus lupulus]